MIKTSGVGREQPLLQLPRLTDRSELCVVSALETYINRTENVRGEIDTLFLSLNKPRRGIYSETISRWLKKCLCLSGIDTDIFSGHSTRHAASSKADKLGVDTDTIRRTTGWSRRSEVFARFYNRPIVSDGFDFARNVLRDGNITN